MADTKVSDFTAGATINATDRMYAIRSPFGTGDDRYVLVDYFGTYFAKSTLAAGTLTDSAPMTLTQTWNDAADTFIGLKVNVTDTASAAASLLMDLQISGTSKFKVTKAGTLTTVGDISIQGSTGLTLIASGAIFWASASIIGNSSNGVIGLYNAAANDFTRLQFGGTTSSFPAIGRDGAGIKIVGGDGTSVSWVKVPSVAIASLPAAATAGEGARSFVTDALAPAFGTAVSAGGAANVPVFSDGSNWIVG